MRFLALAFFSQIISDKRFVARLELNNKKFAARLLKNLIEKNSAIFGKEEKGRKRGDEPRGWIRGKGGWRQNILPVPGAPWLNLFRAFLCQFLYAKAKKTFQNFSPKPKENWTKLEKCSQK